MMATTLPLKRDAFASAPPHQEQKVDAYNRITETLDSATGLSWAMPPAHPSFLRNGYNAKVRLVSAPHMVRRLQEAAIHATGRPRAIVFESCGGGQAYINIPKEIAESDRFLDTVMRGR